MKVNVTFTKEEEGVLKELNKIYDKMNNDTIFNCNYHDCDVCPFDKGISGCAITDLREALRLIIEK